jgi:hypothetical protein
MQHSPNTYQVIKFAVLPQTEVCFFFVHFVRFGKSVNHKGYETNCVICFFVQRFRPNIKNTSLIKLHFKFCKLSIKQSITHRQIKNSRKIHKGNVRFIARCPQNIYLIHALTCDLH